MKIWYFISFLFFLYSINILNKEKNVIIYKSINQPDPYDHLFCFDLKKDINILSNKTTLSLDQLNRIVYNHFNDLEYSKTKSEDLERYNKLILYPIRSKDYFILRDLICLIRKKYDKDDFDFIQSILNTTQFVYKKDSYNLFKLSYDHDKVKQLIVINENNFNCTKNYFKTKCLNQCFKKNRLSKYIYNGNESGIIKLNYEYDETIRGWEYDCLKNQCKENDCKLNHFVSIRPYLEAKTTIFKSTYLISRLDFYIQFTGLVCLIYNIYFHQLLLILFEFVKPKIIKIKKIKIGGKVIKKTNHENYLNLLKKAILIILINCFFYYHIIKTKNINIQMNNPAKTEAKSNQLESEKINLVICMNTEEILENSKYKNMTLSILEKETDKKFNNNLISEIYLDFINKKIKIEWMLTQKVLFKFQNVLLRCFLFEISPNEPKYQSLLTASKLIIKSKHFLFHSLYLLPEKGSFNSKTKFLKCDFFVKKIIKRSKSNKKQKCIDYDKVYSYCNSKQNCIDRCVNRKFVEDYNSITIYSTIDKQHFTKDQWSNLLLNDNNDKYNETREECKIKFQNNDCLEVKFESYFEIGLPNQTKFLSIDLYYEVISQFEEEPSFYKLLIDLLSLQKRSIWSECT